MSNGITNWSFSNLMAFETCKYRIKLKKIDKAKGPPREADNPMERGNRVHKGCELGVQTGSDWPIEAKHFTEQLDHARTLYQHHMATTEEDWKFDADWNVLPNDTPWDDPKLWLWAKLDLCAFDEAAGVVVAVDYKTGKSLYKAIEHVQQMQLYAALVALRMPWATSITTELWYVDEGYIRTATYTREQALSYVGRFDKRAKAMLEEKLFRPNPSKMNCAYCDYSSKRGTGVCPVSA